MDWRLDEILEGPAYVGKRQMKQAIAAMPHIGMVTGIGAD